MHFSMLQVPFSNSRLSWLWSVISEGNIPHSGKVSTKDLKSTISAVKPWAHNLTEVVWKNFLRGSFTRLGCGAFFFFLLLSTVAPKTNPLCLLFHWTLNWYYLQGFLQKPVTAPTGKHRFVLVTLYLTINWTRDGWHPALCLSGFVEMHYLQMKRSML